MDDGFWTGVVAVWGAEGGIERIMEQTDQISGISNLGGLIDAALQVAGKRREKLQHLRTALLNSDTTEVYKYARELCGLEADEERNRTDSGPD